MPFMRTKTLGSALFVQMDAVRRGLEGIRCVPLFSNRRRDAEANFLWIMLPPQPPSAPVRFRGGPRRPPQPLAPPRGPMGSRPIRCGPRLPPTAPPHGAL